MNELPCGKCLHYDPILGPGEKHIGRGWCIKRSKYPAVEGPGQVFPPNAERVEIGQLAEPYLVDKTQVIAPCEFAREAKHDQAEEKQKAQVRTDAAGNRILT